MCVTTLATSRSSACPVMPPREFTPALPRSVRLLSESLNHRVIPRLGSHHLPRFERASINRVASEIRARSAHDTGSHRPSRIVSNPLKLNPNRALGLAAGRLHQL